MSGARKLRQLLSGHEVLQCGGASDAGQALLVQQVGYPVAYMSGAHVNHSRGFPDGTLTLSEISQRAREIAERIDIPLVADGDEGFGGVLKITRTVQEFERGGVAGLHLEDMVSKKHGDVLPIKEAVNRLQAALDARKNPDFVIIARTDALAPYRPGVSENLARCEEDAFERCLAYAEAGADLVMPIYASMSWFQRYGSRLPKPLTMLGGAARTWPGHAPSPLEADLRAHEMAPFNVRLVIYGAAMLSRSYAFMEKEYSSWLAKGRFEATAQDDIDRVNALKLVGLLEKEAMLKKYGE